MMLTAALLLVSTVAPIGPDTACQAMAPLKGRESPLDSVSFKVGEVAVKVCYGRPSLRGRDMVVGKQDPYGQWWRTGANEPTIVFTSAPITIAGVQVPAGVHSLYTVPGETEWEIIINDGVKQWGLDYDEAKDVGRGKAKSDALQQPIEQFTIRPDAAAAKELLLEWQKFRVHVPISAS